VTGSTGGEQSIAVQPLENLGNEPDNACFADGFRKKFSPA